MVKTSKELSLTIYLQWPECTNLIIPLIISASLPSLYFVLPLPWVVYFTSWAIQVIPVWILQFNRLIIFNWFATFKRCQLHWTFITNTENLSLTTEKTSPTSPSPTMMVANLIIPPTKYCHQRPKLVTNFKVPTTRWCQHHISPKGSVS